jgi:hypothetical protein
LATDVLEEYISTIFRGRKISQTELATCFMLGLFFDHEDGGEILLRKVDKTSTVCMALYAGR